MTYAILAGNTITAHGPASLLWPDTSFPASGPNVSFLIDAGAVLIRSDATYDPKTEILQATEPYVLNGEVFNTIAGAKPEPPTPEPDYRAFWDAALTSSVYQALYALSTIDLPANAALTAFTASFQDAKDGRPNPGAIQSCIGLVVQAAAGHLTAEHLSELQGLMDAHSLSGAYTLTPPSQTE